MAEATPELELSVVFVLPSYYRFMKLPIFLFLHCYLYFPTLLSTSYRNLIADDNAFPEVINHLMAVVVALLVAIVHLFIVERRLVCRLVSVVALIVEGLLNRRAGNKVVVGLFYNNVPWFLSILFIISCILKQSLF
ncbi:hypothetical protein K469DRAFT_369952 [Zopfia rhizophila CBS 207.26]|uniref:Uncharacterized protein n=1 Tax=Zopfia rhizophila CBS 207.26 TaxID=1314779 RepID=A0A6A6EH42_9PEZI|nr:hypothetical protein K469DRAFT_369952 [Zopfia rhizophila CBS 207.26]